MERLGKTGLERGWNQACQVACLTGLGGRLDGRQVGWQGLRGIGGKGMITCVVDYVIDPAKVADFERFARAWMGLVERSGGRHHGYFLPSEGASDRALALFSFPSLADYERYREGFGKDPEFVAADRIRDESGCVLRYDRSFMRPLLPE